MGAAAATSTSRRSDWESTRNRILDAACELFEAGGPDAVTMSGVARAAEVNRTTVHRHHPTRDHLLWAVSDRLIAGLDVALGGELHASRLDEGVEAVVGRLVDDPDLARRSLRSLTSPHPGDDALHLLRTETSMMRLLAGGPLGRPGIDAEVLAVVNLAGVLLWSALSESGIVEGGADRYRAEIMRLMLHGAIDSAALSTGATTQGGPRGQ